MENNVQEILYRNYEESLGEELVEVKEEERKPPEVGQVRLFFMTPPEFVLVINKKDNLNVIVPLTSYLQLAITDKYPPLVKWRGYNLVPLPFWVYANEKLLEKYSVPVFKIKELDKIRDYVKTARTAGIGEWREKFIKKTAERFKDLSLSSLIYEVVRGEEAKPGIVIPFPTALKERIESRTELARAAQPTSYLKGENWIGVVEEGRLILHLPKDYAGKKVVITLGDEVIYEGIGEEVITIENVPEASSYTFLEEELSVQVLGD
ncbi:hypothetical protein [Hydrogenivirga sp. 128-5-R1-1]|uniref:hypothetical protein n=1 Tax=Hydrogenivirga sp. 128-5-R1-1 TaxID=392423 RepID=UPI00015F0D00|nr:hypothetical protein [Hydrogenivirga sp. 128-5-R1-1]EDP75983.1 hypothetical protein HG1285_06640 [Hydrogenivirga sp. 128-5-R1-1]